MREAPSGTVTFLFTDIEGSTRNWDRHTSAMAAALERHDALLRDAIAAGGGHVFKTVGDAFCAAFASAVDALGAAVASQRAVQAEDWSAFGHDFPPIRVRMALHTGVAHERDGDYFGPPVNRTARLEAAGHGGQTLISAATWELVRDDLSPDVTLRDLGERRLTDLRRPERVFQVLAPDLPADFPPLATLDARPHNLPVQLTSFIGREPEIVDVKRLLGRSHLVTLTGIGGTGKTRLALQAAADLFDDFEHGVWFVDLAPIVDPALVAQTVAMVVGAHEEPGRPIEATLVDCLQAKRLLIVLDNCEHLIATCADLAGRILHASPGVRILATSREALAIAGEATRMVPPLATPDPANMAAGRADVVVALAQYEAVRLFVDRAVAVKADFAVTNANAPAVAGVCHRLDGIPLAIELAAARVTMLTAEEIHQRLEDRFRLLTGGSRTAASRQRTLAAAIDWSHDLLEPPEQALFRRLAVFQGGWSIEAAEAVCSGDAVESTEVLDLLGRLVDKSLVIADEVGGRTRFRFLQTVMQYAWEKQVTSGEAVRAAHCGYYLDFARTVDPHLDAEDQMEWLARLAGEEDNVRAALGWALDPAADLGAAARLYAAYWRCWAFRGRVREMAEWAARILETMPPDIEPQTRAMTVYAAAIAARFLGDRSTAEVMFPEAIRLFRAQGDLLRLGWALNDFGVMFTTLGDHDDRAESLLAESMAVRRQLGNHYEIAMGLGCLGELARLRGEFERAEALLEESLALFSLPDAAGPALNRVSTLHNLAHLRRRAGDLEGARALFDECLGIYRRLDHPLGVAVCLAGFGTVAAASGLPRRAARLLGAADRLLRDLGIQLEQTDHREFDEGVASARAALDDVTWAAAWTEGMGMDLEDAATYALETGSHD